MGCIYTFKGKEYSEKEFKSLLTESILGGDKSIDAVLKKMVGENFILSPNNEFIGTRTAGISHDSLIKTANRIGLEEPKSGQTLTDEEKIMRGRELINAGIDPQKVADEFKNDKNKSVNTNNISVARAYYEELVKNADKAYSEFGKNSNEFNNAKDKVQKWQDEILKPMATAASEHLASFKGETDLDTGSYVKVARSIEEITGKPLNRQQELKVAELTNKVKELNKKVDELNKKLIENNKKSIESENQSIKDKTKKIADSIRKLKLSKPDSFSAATPASIVWDGAVEAAAKIFEISGDIAQAIKKGVEHIKESDWYKGLSNDKKQKVENDFKNSFESKIEQNEIKKEKTNTEDLIKNFANKTDNKFTSEEATSVWNYVKENYMDKGEPISEMIRKTGIDLGLTSQQVMSAIETPKGAKKITDEMFVLQAKRRKEQQKVKEYIQTTNTPRFVKWAKAIPNFFFRKAVFGHGTVGMITHAGMNVFRPSISKMYWRNFARQFKNSFGAFNDKGMADYEKNMMHLQNDPLFIKAKRAGVKVDPTERADDYTGLKKWMVSNKIAGTGDRGFNALKQFRMDMFRDEYNRLSDIEKNDKDVLKEIGKIVNHATGTTSEYNPGSIISTSVFAPKLEISKWARLVTDPFKAIKTFTRWNESSTAEKVQARIMARKSAELFATYLGGLAINQSLLYATGSNQKVNFTNPSESDWLKFKAGDKTIDLSGGIIPTLQFIGGMLTIPFLSQEELGRKNRKQAVGEKLQNYGLSKLSPFGSTVKESLTAHDFNGNTLPWSNDKPLNKFAHKLSWKEYLLSSQAPIPIAEASREVYNSMEQKGISDPQIEDILNGMFHGMMTGGTGVKVSKDFSKEKNVTVENNVKSF